jgi:hypothetical protein
MLVELFWREKRERLGRERSHFKDCFLPKVEGICVLKTRYIGLREIQVFVATNVKSHLLAEEEAVTFFREKLL